MAHSRSAKKRIRQNIKHRARNRWRLRTMRAAIKEFHQALAHGTVEEAQKALHAAQKAIDRTAQKGVIHRNQAARRMSRLSAKLAAKQGASS